MIRDYLGHSSVATTSRYVSANLDMKRDALEAFWKRAGIEEKGSRKWHPTPKLLAFRETFVADYPEPPLRPETRKCWHSAPFRAFARITPEFGIMSLIWSTR